MSRAASTFRQTDVVRALRAARAAGLEVARYEIGKDGKIVVVTGQREALVADADINEWDASA